MRQANLIPFPRRRERAAKIAAAVRRYWASLTPDARARRGNNISAGRQRQIALAAGWRALAAERDDLPAFERTDV